ncbi:MAG: hypothetical protein ACD_45C00703G0010 [uncultured bacterium]|nr:MAG: hypothetical protein ACD_45C00703G0010 [uncultured bacterium]
MTTLPTPHSKALQHSEKIAKVIREEMMLAGGHLSFARFMELALYAPGLGYYSAGMQKFGRQGDYVTAPEISPLFAKCIAKQCQQILTAIGSGDIIEFGAGSGLFAKDLLLELEQRSSLPTHYFILEVSAELRARQLHLFNTECPHLLTRIQWLDTLPTFSINGIIFANEVLDAMPIHCFQRMDNTIKERCVSWQQDHFSWCVQPFSPETRTHLETQLQEFDLPNGYQSEINLMLSAWITSIAEILRQGTLLLIDYGYGRREYYHPERHHGTLMCFYQHYKHANPLIFPGLQDITAHVDFTSIAESATLAGLSLAGFTTQAAFLLALGLLELDNHAAQLSSIKKYQRNQDIKILTTPAQMGEIIKVIAFNKNLDIPLLGFSLHDRRRNL